MVDGEVVGEEREGDGNRPEEVAEEPGAIMEEDVDGNEKDGYGVGGADDIGECEGECDVLNEPGFGLGLQEDVEADGEHEHGWAVLPEGAAGGRPGGGAVGEDEGEEERRASAEIGDCRERGAGVGEFQGFRVTGFQSLREDLSADNEIHKDGGEGDDDGSDEGFDEPMFDDDDVAGGRGRIERIARTALESGPDGRELIEERQDGPVEEEDKREGEE